MPNINETIEEVEKLNPELARQIRHFVKNHTYGLVFEHNLPEAVRLYTKIPVEKDIVNILPERGQQEKEENKIPWIVKGISDGKALIEHCDEQKIVQVEDIVTVVSYKDTIYPGLKEIDRIERGDKDDPYHMVINAENYHALEALNYCYAGKVDCIYIDPPYNGEQTDWKYNNDFVSPDDKYKHSKWLAFMERRLIIAKQLLNLKNSILIVTIDEKEYSRLGLLLCQMFPEANIQMISSVINPKGNARFGFSRSDEYIYVVMFGNCFPERLPLNNEWLSSANASETIKRINNKKIEPGWTSMMRRGTGPLRINHPTLYYPIYVNPKSKTIAKIGEQIPFGKDRAEEIEGLIQVLPIRENGQQGRWQVGNKELKNRIKQGRVRLGRPTEYGYVINYLPDGEWNDIQKGIYVIEGYAKDGSIIAYKNSEFEDNLRMPPTQWKLASHNASENGSSLLISILGEKRFSFPKSIYAVRDILKFFVNSKPNALIVDFFAGSGTTLHAVNLLNAEDGGHRRCICVTNNEVSEEEEKEFMKKGLRPNDDDWKKYGIAYYVTWPRTKCTIEGHDINNNPLKGNYGCDKEIFEEIEAEVINPETDKKLRSKVYKKSKKPMYPLLSGINKSDGFMTNAIFFELTYESAWPIRLDRAFNAIAPILWMQAGCRGEIINKIGKSFSTTDYYGVLFDYNQASKFCEKVQATPSIKHVYIVTDDQRRYSSLCRRLPGVEVHRLYETYLKTFEICGEGGLD